MPPFVYYLTVILEACLSIYELEWKEMNPENMSSTV